MLAIGGCDKNMPGALIAFARLDVPVDLRLRRDDQARLPRRTRPHDRERLRGARPVRGRQAPARRARRDRARRDPGRRAPAAGCSRPTPCPRRSRRSGMSLPRSSTMAAEDAEKAESAAESARVLAAAVASGLTARQILTRQAFENAIAVVMAVGGSTNAVLHLLAIAHAAQVPLDDRRLRDDPRPGAGAVRPQALRPLRRDRLAPCRRRAAGDADAARPRPRPRRRTHDHRAHASRRTWPPCRPSRPRGRT